MSLFRVTNVVVACAALLTACGGTETEPVETQPATASAPLVSPDDWEGGGGGGGGTGGGTTTTWVTLIDGNTNYGPAGISPNVPLVPYTSGRPDDRCRQSGYAKVSFQSPTTASSTIYFTGIVAPSTKATFHFYNAQSQLVRSHETHHSHDTCVIHHEPETTTVNLPPGTYYIYASYWFVGTHYNSGWYINSPNMPFAFNNRYVGTIQVQ
jgi:hypothetical protein